MTRYILADGAGYIDYTPATKRAVFNDGYGNTKTIVDGYLHSFSDGSGNTVEYTYEGVEPKSVRLYNTSAGLSVNLFSFTYYSTGSNANLQKIQNLETNESVEFLYDSTAMRLDKIIFRKGTVETDWITFGYTNGRITTVNDRASSAFDNPLTVQYDSSGRVTALSRPNGAQTSFAYGNDDAKNRLTKISSSYSSYEDTYQVFSASGRTKSVYSAKRSAAPPSRFLRAPSCLTTRARCCIRARPLSRTTTITRLSIIPAAASRAGALSTPPMPHTTAVRSSK